MSARPSRRQRSMSNLRSLFRRNRDNGNEAAAVSNHDGDNRPASVLRRPSSRLSLRSETRENTRRNSQSNSSLRSQGSCVSFRAFGVPIFSIERTFSDHSPNNPDEHFGSRGRAHTLATDTDGHVQPPPRQYDEVEGGHRLDLCSTYPPPHRGEALASYPPGAGFVGRDAQRNDSVSNSHQQEEEEEEEEEEEGRPSSSHYDSDSSDRTIRRPSPRPQTPPPQQPIRQAPHETGAGGLRETASSPALAGGVGNRLRRTLRRRPAVHFREHQQQQQLQQEQAQQQIRFPEPIARPDMGSSNFAWTVGAGLCDRVERVTIEDSRDQRPPQ